MALTTDLVVAYKFSDGALLTDSEGSNTLTNTNSVSCINTSPVSIDLGYYADMGTPNTNKLLTSTTIPLTHAQLVGGFSISFWFKPLRVWATDSKHQYLFTIANHNGSNIAQVKVIFNKDSDNIYATFFGVISDNLIDLDFIPTSGTWYHIVITNDGTTFRPYINSSAKTTASVTGTGEAWTGTRFDIGGMTADSKFADVSIDEFYVWSRELSSDEVSELYNSGDGLQYPFSAAATGNFFQLFN